MQVTYEARRGCYSPITLLLRGDADGAPSFEVVNPVEFDVADAPEALRSFTVPSGFVYDRATMPLVTRAFVDRDRLDPAALAHDYTLKLKAELGVSRKACDDLFYAVARCTPHLSDLDARLSYYAVRLFSIARGLVPGGR